MTTQSWQWGGATPACAKATTRKRLGEILIESGVMSPDQLEAALAYQRRRGGKLGQAVVRLRMATEPQVVAALSRQTGYATVELSAGTGERAPAIREALRLVPRELAARHLLVPIACDGSSITVAMSDPTNLAVIDEIVFRTARKVKVLLAGEDSIAAAIPRLYGPPPDQSLGVAPATSEPARTADAAAEPERAATAASALERACSGAASSTTIAALLRILVSKGVVTEVELVREIEAKLLGDATTTASPPSAGDSRIRSAA